MLVIFAHRMYPLGPAASRLLGDFTQTTVEEESDFHPGLSWGVFKVNVLGAFYKLLRPGLYLDSSGPITRYTPLLALP